MFFLVFQNPITECVWLDAQDQKFSEWNGPPLRMVKLMALAYLLSISFEAASVKCSLLNAVHFDD